MDNRIKYRYVVSVVEGSIFILLIVFSLLAIFDLLSLEFFNFYEIFRLWSLRVAIILFIFFLILPFLLVYILKLSEKSMVKYNQNRFKSKFLEEVKSSKLIDILDLSRSYDVNLHYIKNFLRDQISEGLLKGELKGDVFHVNKNFKIIGIKEKRIEFMKENIGKFISPHRLIKLKELSNNFKVPKNIVKLYIKNMINQGILNGYLERDTFIRDLSLPLMSIENFDCPHCGKNINLKEKQDSNQ